MKPVIIDKPISELKPFEVKCSDTRCNEGFHYYTSKVAPKDGKIGDCKQCGDDSIDWKRIHRRDSNDLEYTFDSLKKELLRHVCWVNDIDPKAIQNARKRGKNLILDRAKEIITKKIAKIPEGYYDYLCTKKEGSEIINYAQHATGTCCRNCLERWHNIPQDIILSEKQVDYCVGLVKLYIEDRIPDLNN